MAVFCTLSLGILTRRGGSWVDFSRISERDSIESCQCCRTMVNNIRRRSSTLLMGVLTMKDTEKSELRTVAGEAPEYPE